LGREEERDTALGVTRGVKDLRGVVGNPDHHAVFGAAVGRNDFGRGNAEPASLLVHDGELGQVVLVEKDGGASCAFEAGGATDMVDVAMGDDDLLQSEFVSDEKREDLRDVVAGIDDHGLARGLVAEDGAVALEGADGEGFKDHGCFYCRRMGAGERRKRAGLSARPLVFGAEDYLLFGVLCELLEPERTEC
jgi:hypothetical protein